MHVLRSCSLAAALLGLCAGLFPPLLQAKAQQHPHVEVELVADQRAVASGGRVTVALRLQPENGWHTYWQNPGDSGLATTVDWQLPEGVEAGPLQWPFPHRESLGPLTNYGYAEEHFLLADLRLPVQSKADRLELRVRASWLVCKEICIPGEADLSLSLPYGQASPSAWAGAIAAGRAAVPERLTMPAQFAVEEQQFRLQLDAQDWNEASLQFFPLTPELVANAVQPQIRRHAQWLEVRLPVSEYLGTVPDTMQAVLVIDGQRAVQFEARRVEANLLLNPRDASAAPLSAGLSLSAALLFALLGGLILNLMPCVFPVLSIKAVAIAQHGGQSASTRQLQGLLYSAGVLSGFLVLAGVLLALRAAGEAIGWGFQLQAPGFVAATACLMLVLGLALHGYWQFGTRLMGLGHGLTQAQGARGTFFTGVLACIVATPCTGPFMGPAMGYALTQSAVVALSVFAALGLGMALPFLLLGFWPGLAGLLPKPGAWMERFRRAMAFPLYATAIWLLWVLGRQLGVDAMALVLLAMLALVLAIALGQQSWRAGLSRMAALLAVVLAGLLLWQLQGLNKPPSGPGLSAPSQAYSAQTLQALLDDGKPVFVNLTADWCLTCKVNERGALAHASVRQAMAEKGVTSLVGDWTQRDPAITRLLEKFDRSGVPLYLLYSGQRDTAPVVLPQILTPAVLLAELDKLEGIQDE